MVFLTTRFTDKTYMENCRARKNLNVPCIYGLSKEISPHHPYEPLYIIEMNNSINQIMGIGIIKKKISLQKYNIYSDPFYNSYIYKGYQHFSRDDLPLWMVDELETLLFKGKGHMKRGQGMTLLPKIHHKPEYYDVFIS